MISNITFTNEALVLSLRDDRTGRPKNVPFACSITDVEAVQKTVNQELSQTLRHTGVRRELNIRPNISHSDPFYALAASHITC